MAKHKSKIVKELDPKDVEGFSEARIQHYLSLGYHPFLDERSKVKWLTPAQANMRVASRMKVPFSHYIFTPKSKGRYRRRRRRNRFLSFVLHHWLFIVLTLLVIVGFAYIYLFTSILY